MGVDPNLNAVLEFLSHKEEMILFFFMGVVGVLWVILGTISSMLTRFSRERTRREIAAYIAEGSMTPEQGERLLRAKPKDEDDEA